MKKLMAFGAVLTAAAALTMPWCRPATMEPSKGTAMTWSDVKTVNVPAKPGGVWTWGVDYVKGPALILVEAVETGKWSYSPGRECGPDGDPGALLSASSVLLPGAPIGALIVKIGGSTAGLADGSVRVAGRKALIEIDAKVSGPIFLTINDEAGGLADNTGALEVTISIALIAGAPPAPNAPAAPAAGGAGAQP